MTQLRKVQMKILAQLSKTEDYLLVSLENLFKCTNKCSFFVDDNFENVFTCDWIEQIMEIMLKCNLFHEYWLKLDGIF